MITEQKETKLNLLEKLYQMKQLGKKVAPEKIVQKAVIAKLKSYGCYVARINNAKIAGSGSFVKLRDDEKGVPDAIACIGGRFVGFEFKSLTGVQSVFQKAQEKWIKENGGEYFLIRTEKEFDILWQENLKFKAALTANMPSRLAADRLL
jgi:hypothetical protein